MLVQQILKAKANGGEVKTVQPGSSVADAARLLSELRIGSVVVSSGDGKMEGILSERDIVRELGRRGPTCLSDTVDDLMTRELVTCTKEETALSVLEKMSKGRFRHMPVLENGKMIGLISIGDVVQARLAELDMEKNALEGMIMGH